MSSCHTLFLFFSLALALLFTASDATNLIQQTCKTSSRGDPNIPYNFCVHALQAAPASQCANFSRLGLISISLIKYNVTDTRCLIKQLLLHDRKMDTDTKAVLDDCLELYTDSLPTLREAELDYRARRFDDANVKISSVMEASTSCEDGFKEVGVVSPLTVQNNRSFQLSAIALSIINALQSPNSKNYLNI